MAGSLVIVNGAEVQRALANLVELGNKDGVRVLNLAGRLWSSFAYKNTKAADPASIERYLLARIRPARGRSKYSGTIAEAIVRKMLRKRGREKTSQREVNRLTRKFITKSKNSAQYHKSGWIPAMKSFGVKGNKNRGKGRYKSALAGSAKTAVKGEAYPNGFLENEARAIAGVQPDVLRRTEGQVARLLEKFLADDIKAAGRRQGFR
jgi:hypothetical protein